MAKKETENKKASPKKESKSKKKAKNAVEVKSLPSDYIPRLRIMYGEKIIPAMQEQFNYKNPMLVPRLSKIVLNVGIGSLHQDQKLADSIQDEMKLISGLKPVLTRARKSIANFKLRQHMLVGCRVTLRKAHMYEFLDRLISIVIPRIRDFRGMSDRSFDGRGNYNFGIKEQIVFPEIDYDNVVKIHGMDISIATTARTDEEALELLRSFGFPFRRRVADQEAA